MFHILYCDHHDKASLVTICHHKSYYDVNDYTSYAAHLPHDLFYDCEYVPLILLHLLPIP